MIFRHFAYISSSLDWNRCQKKLILDFQKGEKYGRLLPQIIAVSPNFGTLKKVHQNLCIAICWFYELLSF